MSEGKLTLTDIDKEILTRFKRGQVLWRSDLLKLGATRPLSDRFANPRIDLKALRSNGVLIWYIQGGIEPCWIAPELARQAGVTDIFARVMQKQSTKG